MGETMEQRKTVLPAGGGQPGGDRPLTDDSLETQLRELRSCMSDMSLYDRHHNSADRYCTDGDAREAAAEERRGGMSVWTEAAANAPRL